MTGSDDVAVKVCRDFQKGNCSWGNKCKFSHPKLTNITTMTSDDVKVEVYQDFQKGNSSQGNKCKFSHPEVIDLTMKTSDDDVKVEVCTDFQKGICFRGNKCHFLHIKSTDVEVCRDFLTRVHRTQEQDVSYDSGILPARLQAGYSTIPMNNSIAAGSSDITHGKRFRDDSFNFQTDLSPLAKKAFLVKKEMESRLLCRDFLDANCYRGDKCKYFHPILGSGSSEVNSPCRDFGKGKCMRGIACKYFHPKLETCRDFQNVKCERETCRFLHMTRQEETTYMDCGQVPDHINESKLKSCKILDFSIGQGVGNNGAILGKQFDNSDVLGKASALQENTMLKLKVEELQSHITDLRKMNDALYEQNTNHRKQAQLSI